MFKIEACATIPSASPHIFQEPMRRPGIQVIDLLAWFTTKPISFCCVV